MQQNSDSIDAKQTAELKSQIMNILNSSLFINLETLLSNIVFAAKDAEGRVAWVALEPEYRGKLVRAASSLMHLHGVGMRGQAALVENALFTFLLQILNGASQKDFFSRMKTMRDCDCATPRRRSPFTDSGLDLQVNNTSPTDSNSKEATVVPAAIDENMTAATSPTLSSSRNEVEEIVNPLAPVVDEEDNCGGLRFHPTCEECDRFATGVKLNRYPKCNVHRLHYSGAYVHGYEDYSCTCAEYC